MRAITISLVLSFGVLAAACGNHGPASPTGPSSATSAGPTSGGVSTGTMISGTVLGMSTASRWTTLASGLTVTINGGPSTTVDSTGHFTLQNVPTGRIDLHFTGAGIDAHLQLDNVAERQTITIVVRVTPTTAELENNEREDQNHNAEVEGRVASIAGSTLMVGTRTVNVTATTRIVHGDTALTMASIHVGDRIHVEGTVNGAAIDAAKIEVQNGVETPGRGDEQKEMEISGLISNKSGTCPALTFTVGSTQVVTNASTQFKDTACSALANSMSVEVKGTMQSTGSVLATRVEAKNAAAAANVELKGAMSGKTGACPALTFTVSSTTVVTDASTKFEDTTCAALANGMVVEVKGTRQANGSVLAMKVEADDELAAPPAAGAQVELKGAISGKGGTCPALTFTVSSMSVVTNASTQFKDVACASLANGMAVEVKGTKQSNGSVLATRVEKD